MKSFLIRLLVIVQCFRFTIQQKNPLKTGPRIVLTVGVEICTIMRKQLQYLRLFIVSNNQDILAPWSRAGFACGFVNVDFLWLNLLQQDCCMHGFAFLYESLLVSQLSPSPNHEFFWVAVLDLRCQIKSFPSRPQKQLGYSKARQLEILLCDRRYTNCFEIFSCVLRSLSNIASASTLPKVRLYTCALTIPSKII